jgi:DNA-binding protein H-NS
MRFDLSVFHKNHNNTMERLTRTDSNHIICGRGNRKYNCEGNKVFRRIIERHLSHYINATRSKKSELIKRVTEELQNLGMIFMAITNDGVTLEELSPIQARKKVAHRFRDTVRTAKQFDTSGMSHQTTDRTFSYQQVSEKNIPLSIDCPILHISESMSVKRIMLMSESLDKDQMEQATQLTLSLAEHLHSQSENELDATEKSEAVVRLVSSTDAVFQEAMLTYLHPARSVLYPETKFSLSSEKNTERLPSQNETSVQQEVIADDIIDVLDVFDVFDIFDTHDTSDYLDDYDAFDDLSLLLSNTDNMIEVY